MELREKIAMTMLEMSTFKGIDEKIDFEKLKIQYPAITESFLYMSDGIISLLAKEGYGNMTMNCPNYKDGYCINQSEFYKCDKENPKGCCCCICLNSCKLKCNLLLEPEMAWKFQPLEIKQQGILK